MNLFKRKKAESAECAEMRQIQKAMEHRRDDIESLAIELYRDILDDRSGTASYECAEKAIGAAEIFYNVLDERFGR